MHSVGGRPAALPGHPQYEPEQVLGPHGAPVLTHSLVTGQPATHTRFCKIVVFTRWRGESRLVLNASHTAQARER